MQKRSPNSSSRNKQQGFRKNSAQGERSGFKKKDYKRSGNEGDKPFGKEGRWQGKEPRDNGYNREHSAEQRPFDKKKKWDSEKPHRQDRQFDEKKPFKKRDDSTPFRERKKSFEQKEDNRPLGERQKPFKKRDDSMPIREGKKSFEQKEDKRPFGERQKPFGKKEDSRPFRERGKHPDRKDDTRPFRERQKPFNNKEGASKFSHDRPDKKKKIAEKPTFDKLIGNAFNPEKKKNEDEFSKPHKHEDKVYGALEDVEKSNVPLIPFKAKRKEDVDTPHPKKTEGKRKKKYYDDEDEDVVKEEAMPLNKYIAHSGECSRRDAAELVKQGKVKVNGELVLDPGYKVKPDDLVTLVGKKLKPTKNNVYILLNKPKGYITTNDDPQGRRTVMELVEGAGADRLFPVGRLDRDTSGLLLITNDGDLTQKLSHPSHEIKKVYQVTLDKPLTKADFEKVINGVELEDGKAIVDELAYLETKNELGLEIHSGRNRIVRRIFESLGYVVEKLDRVMYAGLTKKNLPRGKWRFLDSREVVILKHFKAR